MTSFACAALFDMDGVIVNNMSYHIDSWYQFAERYGRQISDEEYSRHINGRVAADSLPYVFGRTLTPDEITTLTEEKEAIYRDLYQPHLQPTPGLTVFLTALKANNFGLAVGTSAPVSNITFTLDGLNLRSRFDVIIDASMIQRGKPDPEIYLTAARRLGVAPDRCVVFEDAFSGIEAGLRAGMKVVALATTHTREELEATGAQRIIPDFRDIDAHWLKQLMEE